MINQPTLKFFYKKFEDRSVSCGLVKTPSLSRPMQRTSPKRHYYYSTTTTYVQEGGVSQMNKFPILYLAFSPPGKEQRLK